MRLTRLRRVASGGAALALSAGVCAVIGLSAPAGAVTNNPAGNPTEPSRFVRVGLHRDPASRCRGSASCRRPCSLCPRSARRSNRQRGPDGDDVRRRWRGHAHDAWGAVVAPLNAALDPATLRTQVTETFAATDGTATGTYAYSVGPRISEPGRPDHRRDVGHAAHDDPDAAPSAGIPGRCLVAASPTGTPPAGFPRNARRLLTGWRSSFTISASRRPTPSAVNVGLRLRRPVSRSLTPPLPHRQPRSRRTGWAPAAPRASESRAPLSGITTDRLPPGISLPFGTWTPGLCCLRRLLRRYHPVPANSRRCSHRGTPPGIPPVHDPAGDDGSDVPAGCLRQPC